MVYNLQITKYINKHGVMQWMTYLNPAPPRNPFWVDYLHRGFLE